MTVYEHEDGQVRTFDRIPTPTHLRASHYVSKEDLILQGQIDALAARLTAVEHALNPTPVPPTPPAPVPAAWATHVDLDQEAEGECVGHGWAHFLAADPKPDARVGTQIKQNPTAEALYESAQRHDGSPPDEQSGASVGGGAKACVDIGAIKAAHFSSKVADVVSALAVGPVVMGTDWHAGMMNPDGNGQIHATGSVVGGHCYLISAHDAATHRFLIHNSWGSSWGHNGDAWISEADLTALLAAQGEAWVGIKA
jgi:hypothetical protein